MLGAALAVVLSLALTVGASLALAPAARASGEVVTPSAGAVMELAQHAAAGALAEASTSTAPATASAATRAAAPAPQSAPGASSGLSARMIASVVNSVPAPQAASSVPSPGPDSALNGGGFASPQVSIGSGPRRPAGPGRRSGHLGHGEHTRPASLSIGRGLGTPHRHAIRSSWERTSLPSEHLPSPAWSASSAAIRTGAGAEPARPPVRPSSSRGQRHKRGITARSDPPVLRAVSDLSPLFAGPGVGSSGAGAGAGGGGGIGGAPAIAFLALAGLCLLQAPLPGRLSLTLLPWRSAPAATPLERPG
jgi:hypothetical protein